MIPAVQGQQSVEISTSVSNAFDSQGMVDHPFHQHFNLLLVRSSQIKYGQNGLESRQTIKKLLFIKII